jgi:flap endonuclease-1
MGIKNLNRYLQQQCSEGIKKISLNDLRGKKIAIDTSIYLYRFVGENALLENFYLMISIFREYNIIPLFVFDGKPPKEKNELLKKRKDDKKIAQNKYNELKEKLEIADENNIKEIKENMEILKKNFIKVHHTDIENVKELIKALGVSYIEAPGEADKLCAKLVCKNKVYACLSEDMDLFVYGTTRVLRYLSLLNKTVIMYDTKSILSQLNVTLDEFKSICIISGTDYGAHSDNSLFKTLKYFKKYKKSDKNDFYEWLDENTKYVDNIYNLYGVVSLFNLGDMPEYKDFEQIRIMNSPINESIVINIMEKENFIFVN